MSRTRPRTRPRSLRRRLAAIGAVLVAGGAGCTGSVNPPPPQPPVVNVTMKEYAFSYTGTVTRGRVVFKVQNAGHLDHKLTLVYLPDDLPPIKQQLEGGQRVIVNALAETVERPPGSRDTFAAELPPGRWAFVCYAVNADGTSHAQLGMATEFRVA